MVEGGNRLFSNPHMDHGMVCEHTCVYIHAHIHRAYTTHGKKEVRKEGRKKEEERKE